MKTKILISITATVLLAAFILGATGKIDLAQPKENNLRNTSDRLIGVMLTKESLHLFDFESYFNDHAADILNGNNIISDTDGYEERIYAVLTDVTHTDGETGKTVHSKEYAFPDVEGFYIYTATVQDANGAYTTTVNGGNGLSDITSGSHYKDNGEEQTLEATIYTTADSDLYTVYANPIYQTESGEVYLVAGTGTTGNGGITQTLKETTTFTKDGEDYSYTAEIIIHREEIEAAEQITITQFTADHEQIYSDTYAFPDHTDTVTARAETAYMIVCEETGDAVNYRIVQRSDESFEVFKADQNGICEKIPIGITWLTESDFSL